MLAIRTSSAQPRHRSPRPRNGQALVELVLSTATLVILFAFAVHWDRLSRLRGDLIERTYTLLMQPALRNADTSTLPLGSRLKIDNHRVTHLLGIRERRVALRTDSIPALPLLQSDSTVGGPLLSTSISMTGFAPTHNGHADLFWLVRLIGLTGAFSQLSSQAATLPQLPNRNALP